MNTNTEMTIIDVIERLKKLSYEFLKTARKQVKAELFTEEELAPSIELAEYLSGFTFKNLESRPSDFSTLDSNLSKAQLNPQVSHRLNTRVLLKLFAACGGMDGPYLDLDEKFEKDMLKIFKHYAPYRKNSPYTKYDSVYSFTANLIVPIIQEERKSDLRREKTLLKLAKKNSNCFFPSVQKEGQAAEPAARSKEPEEIKLPKIGRKSTQKKIENVEEEPGTRKPR